jgi:hypothetical protein
MKIILAVFGLILLSGCLKITDIPEVSQQANLVTGKGQVFEKDGISSEILDQSEPNSYHVRIRANGEIQSLSRWLVNGPQEKEVIQMEVGQDTAIDSSVRPGTAYAYEIQLTNGEVKTLEIYTPIDLEIHHEIVLQKNEQWTQYRRIFLHPGAVITTLNHQLQISTQRMISSGGLIRSFPEGFRSPQGQPGLTGGRIQIESWGGEGLLKIQCLGGHGGNGAPSRRQMDDGDPGQTGGDSCSGSLQFFGDHSLKFQIQIAAGGPGAGGAVTISEIDCGRPRLARTWRLCPSGKPGPDGKPGQPREFCVRDSSGQICRTDSWSN